MSGKLVDGSALLVDLSSFGDFIQAMKVGLNDKRTVGHYEHKLMIENDFWISQAFELLANFISFDKIVIDQRAFASYQQAQDLTDVLKTTGLMNSVVGVRFPLPSYDAAEEQLLKLKSILWEELPKAKKKDYGRLEDLFGYKDTMGVDDATICHMFDGKTNNGAPQQDKDDAYHLRSSLADTGQSVERILVYLEVARQADIPTMIARSKYKALQKVGKELGSAAAKIIKERCKSLPAGTGTGLGGVQEALRKSAIPKAKFSAPLLPGRILTLAKERQCSVIEAVITLRDDPSAQSFRDYLWESRKAFDPIYAIDHVKAAAHKARLKELGARIAKAGSAAGVNVTTRKLRFNTSNVPHLGYVLHMLGLNFKLEKAISMPRLTPPPTYELFMAEWFK